MIKGKYHIQYDYIYNPCRIRYNITQTKNTIKRLRREVIKRERIK